MKTVKARIHWKDRPTAERCLPSKGSRYSTVAKFESLKSTWPKEGWSLIVERVSGIDDGNCIVASICFLAGNDGPNEILECGEHFELYEGRVKVATGEITEGS